MNATEFLIKNGIIIDTTTKDSASSTYIFGDKVSEIKMIDLMELYARQVLAEQDSSNLYERLMEMLKEDMEFHPSYLDNAVKTSDNLRKPINKPLFDISTDMNAKREPPIFPKDRVEKGQESLSLKEKFKQLFK